MAVVVAIDPAGVAYVVFAMTAYFAEAAAAAAVVVAFAASVVEDFAIAAKNLNCFDLVGPV